MKPETRDLLRIIVWVYAIWAVALAVILFTWTRGASAW